MTKVRLWPERLGWCPQHTLGPRWTFVCSYFKMAWCTVNGPIKTKILYRLFSQKVNCLSALELKHLEKYVINQVCWKFHSKILIIMKLSHFEEEKITCFTCNELASYFFTLFNLQVFRYEIKGMNINCLHELQNLIRIHLVYHNELHCHKTADV